MGASSRNPNPRGRPWGTPTAPALSGTPPEPPTRRGTGRVAPRSPPGAGQRRWLRAGNVPAQLPAGPARAASPRCRGPPAAITGRGGGGAGARGGRDPAGPPPSSPFPSFSSFPFPPGTQRRGAARLRPSAEPRVPAVREVALP